ncbi:MAG: cobalt-precorrin-5B (C(1))-methyltransferase [Prevotella sp.]|nr:cobalt-precorrin-5B (C(1))-methyltransferase [Prevotella sp.]
MILVFGGTTEGRKAVEVLEEAGSPFFYSTKTGEQDLTLQHGTRTDGAMDAEAMKAFIRQHGIRLIVDAAHPFASTLHQTIAAVSEDCQIPFIRYERIYPPRDPDITWIDDYSQIPDDIHSLLATTGVQSISRLKYLEERGVRVYYRILPRELSLALAKEQGASLEQLCYYEDSSVIDIDAEAILLKESGETGGFSEKVAAARAKGMRIIALKRPKHFTLHSSLFTSVNGPYGLRRAVEHLLPEFFPLHSGLTTGTCATAAAVAATMRLTKGETPKEVPVILPNGETIQVPVTYGDDYASCFKEAGDDPDITNGVEVRAKVIASDKHGQTRTNWSCAEKEVRDSPSQSVAIYGGAGVGTITLPGFDYPPGSPAINKAPREMIRHNLEKLCTSVSLCLKNISVTISVPNGAEIAKKTFNPRLGIEGGISIIGVSGIVKPFSEEAFIDSIRKCMIIAQASGTGRVVINSGGKSERFVKALYPDLPRQAFVEYGNYIGETLKMAHELHFKNVTLGVMLGKAVKLAAGHLDTHSRKTTMDLDFIRQMLQESGISIDINDITLARELWERIPSTQLEDFAQTVIRHCADYCNPLLPDGSLTILLIDDNGNIYS